MKRTTRLFVVSLFVISPAALAVMPPSTSLEDPAPVVDVVPAGSGRYQIVAGRVTLPGAPKTKSPQAIDTIIKLDKQTGKSWFLDILPNAQRCWVELKG